MPGPRCRSIAFAAASLGPWLGLAPDARSQVVPHGYAVQEVVLEPFDANPVGFALLPDGRPLVIEKDTGNVRLAAVGSTSSIVILTIPNVAVTWEQGLVGIAVDPSWPKRPYVYFDTTHSTLVTHVVMYKASGDLEDPTSTNLTLDSPYLLLGDIPDLQGFHQAGTLRFGADSRLYVSVGDDGAYCDAQDRTRLKGKILRLDVSHMPGVGNGPPSKQLLFPPDNPFAFSNNENERLVYSYGLRNPYRFVVDPQTDDLFIGDVGQDHWEEVDWHRGAGHRGMNFGWPEFEGSLQDPVPGYTSCSAGNLTQPIYLYAHDGGLFSVVAGPLYRPVAGSDIGLPQSYNGSLFVCEFFEQWVRRLVRSSGGGSWVLAPQVPGQPSLTDWAQDLGSVSDMQEGHDGAIYFMNYLDGPTMARGLHRIVRDLASDVASTPPGGMAARSIPNPARAAQGSTIHYRLAAREPVSVRIYDAAGKLVRILDQGSIDAGTVFWDGRSQHGTPVAAGVYVFRLVTPTGEKARGKLSVLQ